MKRERWPISRVALIGVCLGVAGYLIIGGFSGERSTLNQMAGLAGSILGAVFSAFLIADLRNRRVGTK